MQEILLLQNTLKEAKRWRLMSFLLFLVIVGLIASIIIMLPLKEKQLAFVAFSESGKHNFKILPSPLGKKQKVLLIRQALRDYVEKRVSYTGNYNIDTPTVKQIVAMSTREVRNQYEETYNRIDKETTIERRDVKIISDIPIGKNAHQVQYKTIDHYRGSTYENHWVAKISYELQNQITIEENELLNPLGIVVNEFIEAKKTLGEDELNEIF